MYLFVEKINFINLIIFILLRIVGIKVYYFRLSNTLRKKKLILFLNQLNISFINFSEKKFYDEINFGEISNEARDILIENVNRYCDNLNFNKLRKFFVNSDILKVFFIRKFSYEFKNIFFANAIAEKFGIKKYYLWINLNTDSEKFLPISIRNKNLRPNFLKLFDNFFNLLKFFFKILSKKIKLPYKKKISKKQIITKSFDAEYLNKKYIFFLTKE